MSIKLMAQVWDIDDPELNGARLLALLSLADHANDEGICWPSIPRLAKRARVSDRQAKRVIQWLEAHDYIRILEKGNGRGKSTLYHLSLKGDMLSLNTRNKGDMVSSYSHQQATEKGDTQRVKGDICDIKGDIAMSPEPSIEPPIDPSEEEATAVPSRPADHPAVIEFREVWRRYPSKPQMDTIIARVEDIPAWNKAMRAWADRGYKPTNVAGMLDFYAHPDKYRTPHQSPNSFKNKAEANDEVFARMRERINGSGHHDGARNHVHQLPQRPGE